MSNITLGILLEEIKRGKKVSDKEYQGESFMDNMRKNAGING